MPRKKRKAKRVSGRSYSAALKKLARLKRQWLSLRQRLHRDRKRMIASNSRHAKTAMPKRLLKSQMTRKFASDLKKATRTAGGKKGDRRFRKFWKVPAASRISWFDDRPLKKLRLGALVGMGKSGKVVLRLAGQAKNRTLRGKWTPYTDASGKRILILSGRPIKGPFKKIGVAPETWYTPTKATERAGTHKAKAMWRHLHTDDGGKPPVVYADRNGKVDRHSNFVYGRGTYSVTDWIRR